MPLPALVPLTGLIPGTVGNGEDSRDGWRDWCALSRREWMKRARYAGWDSWSPLAASRQTITTSR